jgi:serine protease inhibitor
MLAMTGCTPLTDPQATDTVDPAVIAAQNRFGLSLYHRLASGGTANEQGIFISPSSIALALAMTYNGARGETQTAMSHALGYDSLSLDTINSSYAALLQQVAHTSANTEGIALRMANGLWQHEGVAFSRDFLRRNQRFYQATVRSLDFAAPGSVDVINQWVSEHTEGRIPRLLEQISPRSVLFLINATYFKGDWTQPFDPRLTRTMPFHLAGGGQQDMPMMHMEGPFQHYQGQGFQAVRLPYGKEGLMAMYLFLPDLGSDLKTFHEQLTYDNWEQWLAGFSQKRGRLAIPRFRLDFKVQLNRTLQELGMAIAFDANRADFSGMRPVSPGANLSISEVIHQSFLLVNEKGTEAAAATSVGMRLTSAPMYQFNFIADRPFFLVIRDEMTGAMLFMGSVLAPNAAEANSD